MSKTTQTFGDTRTILTIDNTKANIDISSVIALAESDGTPKSSLYGKVGATLTAISLAANGEQDVVMHGEDSGGNVDPLRTNANMQLQVEIIGTLGSETAKILGTADPSAATNTALYNVAASTVAKITTLTAANRSTSPVKIRVGIDVGGNGTDTPSAAEWIYYNVPVPPESTLSLDACQGLWLAALDDLVVYAASQNIAFVASGIEYA